MFIINKRISKWDRNKALIAIKRMYIIDINIIGENYYYFSKINLKTSYSKRLLILEYFIDDTKKLKKENL